MNALRTSHCRALALVALLCTALLPAALSADDQLDHLTEEQNAYVNKIEDAIAEGYTILMDIQYLTSGSKIGDALVTHKIDTSVVLGELDGCIGRLSGIASILREPPPTAMRGLIGTNESTASTLETAYSSCREMLVEEGANQLVEAGKETLENLLGGGSNSSGSGIAAAARVTSCLSQANGKVTDALAATRGALSARAAELQKEDELERDLFGDIAGGMCFVATAAYGTNSAAEIDVLRDFRDDVLLQSPAGRDCVAFYYEASPPLADFIAGHEVLRFIVREGLIDPIVAVCSLTDRYWRS